MELLVPDDSPPKPCRDWWDSKWDGFTEWWINLRNGRWTEEFSFGWFCARATFSRYRGRYFKRVELFLEDGDPIGPDFEWDIYLTCEAVQAYSSAKRWLDQFPEN